MIFQSHLGLHRMNRLFFRLTNSSVIFHHKVTKVFVGLRGCIMIHDNLLVFGSDEDREKGVTLKLSKSLICAADVKWFGHVYLAAGVLADRDKIHRIMRAGRPEKIKDVRLLLQAAAYNAKYGLDHHETKTYKEVTALLRQLLFKDCEDSFQTLLRMMNSRTYLAPHHPKRKKHPVTNASPCGIAALLH